MLSYFRAFSQSSFGKYLVVGIMALGLISFSFSGRFHTITSDAVIQAGSHEVSPAIFKRVFDNSLADLEKQAGQQTTPQDAVAHGFDREILEGLATDESSIELASRMGLRASPDMITAELRKQPDFFDPITGKFSEKQLEAKLADIQLTPDQFIGQLNDELIENQLMSGLNAGLQAPRMYGAMMAAYGLEERSLSYVVFDPRTQPQPPAPTDAQLVAFMKQHNITEPEMRVLTVVKFSPSALAPTMPVDQAEVQKLYAFKKDSLSTPEKRTLVEVPTKAAASAAKAIQALRGGQAPDAVAKSLGLTAIPYNDVNKAAIADPQVADAAFSTAAGQVSQPIHSDLTGFPVVKVTAVTPASTPTLESLRPQLETQARTDAARRKAFAGVQAFDAAHQAGASLADAAKKAGFETVSIGPMSSQGAGLTAQPIDGLTPALLKAAFNLSQGGETDAIDGGQGEYFAVRVEKIIPPGMPALADVRGPLTQSYEVHEVLDALQAKANQLADQVRKGQSLAAAAAAAKLPVGQAAGIARQKASQYSAIGDSLLGQIFLAKAGDVIVGQTATGAIMVAHVDALTPAAPGVASATLLGEANQNAQLLFQDLNESAREWAKRKIKPTYDVKLAHEALGITDTDLPAGSSGAPAPGTAP